MISSGSQTPLCTKSIGWSSITPENTGPLLHSPMLDELYPLAVGMVILGSCAAAPEQTGPLADRKSGREGKGEKTGKKKKKKEKRKRREKKENRES